MWAFSRSLSLARSLARWVVGEGGGYSHLVGPQHRHGLAPAQVARPRRQHGPEELRDHRDRHADFVALIGRDYRPVKRDGGDRGLSAAERVGDGRPQPLGPPGHGGSGSGLGASRKLALFFLATTALASWRVREGLPLPVSSPAAVSAVTRNNGGRGSFSFSRRGRGRVRRSKEKSSTT